MVVKMNVKNPGAYGWVFSRVKPSDIDIVYLEYIVTKYDASCGYIIESKEDINVIKGYIGFPVYVNQDYMIRRLPNFLVLPVKDKEYVIRMLNENETTVWYNKGKDYFDPVKIDLMKKFV